MPEHGNLGIDVAAGKKEKRKQQADGNGEFLHLFLHEVDLSPMITSDPQMINYPLFLPAEAVNVTLPGSELHRRGSLRHILMVIFLLSAAGAMADDWQTRVDLLLQRGFASLAEVDAREERPAPAEVEEAATLAPDWRALRDFIIGRPLRRRKLLDQQLAGIKNHLADTKTETSNDEVLLLNHIIGTDGVSRPWGLYLPPQIASYRSLPMLVALHGGVSRQNIYENPVEVIKESPWFALARAQGWVLLFPFGQEGAAWWDSTGMTNIRRLIRTVKHHVNIDDNRVFLGGFSDGASGSFLHAMLTPDDFAAIIALNGHMGVGSLDGKLPLYAPNLTMTPVYAVTTDNDEYYPTRQMAPVIAMASRAGADILYRQLQGGHDFAYHASEMPLIGQYLRRRQRNAHPDKVFWEAGDAAFGACRWLQIAEIGHWPAADWHVDHNCILTDETIVWGFTGVRGKEGITVSRIDRGGYAEAVGLRCGDVLRRAGGCEISDSFSLKAAKESARCGQPFEFVVSRLGKRVRLPGILPQPEGWFLFRRDVPSAAIRAEKIGNEVVIAGSRVAKLVLAVMPGHFDLTRPVRVVFNGRVIHDELVKPDPAVILAEYAANRDRKALPVARLVFTLTGDEICGTLKQTDSGDCHEK